MSEWQTLYRAVDLHVQQHAGEKLQGNWRDTFKECIQKRCSCATKKEVGRLCVCDAYKRAQASMNASTRR